MDLLSEAYKRAVGEVGRDEITDWPWLGVQQAAGTMRILTFAGRMMIYPFIRQYEITVKRPLGYLLSGLSVC